MTNYIEKKLTRLAKEYVSYMEKEEKEWINDYIDEYGIGFIGGCFNDTSYVIKENFSKKSIEKYEDLQHIFELKIYELI